MAVSDNHDKDTAILTHGHEVVFDDLADAGPLQRVSLQQFLDERASEGADAGGDVVFVLLNSQVSVLQRLGLKWRLAHQHCIPEAKINVNVYNSLIL